MIGLTPHDEFWDAIFTGLILFSIGAYLLWLWPRRIRRKVRQNRLSEEEAESVLSKIPPRQGYLFVVIAFGVTFMELWRAGTFGYSRMFAIVPGAISVGLFIFWLRHRKNT